MTYQHDETSGVREGEILAGKYRVERVLGVGGMGVVVAAHHLQLDQRVALKFLLPAMLSNADAVTRFAREGRAAVRIRSEHVARVYDVGALENGAPFMVMEYLEGKDLSMWLGQHGPLPIEQAVEFVLQTCEAIAEAHALGIIHRDLKPANLFVIRRPDNTPSVKVLDFGISKSESLGGSAIGSSITKTSALMGSPLYMSPEQMESSKVDARSDIWALGVILHELLAGEPPFAASTMPALIIQIMSAPPHALRSKRADAPPGIEAVIFRCLDKNRGNRFQTVADLAVALLPFAPSRARVSVERISGIVGAASFSATDLVAPSSETLAPPTQTIAPYGRTVEGPRGQRRTLLGVTLILGALAVVFMVGSLYRMRRSPPPPPAATAASTIPTISSSVFSVESTVSPPAVPPDEVRPLQMKPEPARLQTESPIRVPLQHQRQHVVARSTAEPKPPTPPSNANCEPNFYLDAQGEKHFKPECFAR